MHVSDRTKAILKRVGVVVAIAWIAWITAATGRGRDDQARGLSSLGGGPITGGGGGIGKVTLDSSGSNLCTGSGTSTNPLICFATSTGNIQGNGSAGSAFNVVASPSLSGITLTGSANASALSGGTTYDWDPTGGGNLTNVYVINETPSADSSIGGMVAGTIGQAVVIKNLSTSKKLTLTNEDGSESTAGRRFTLPDAGSLVIRPSGAVIMRYASSSRWIPLTTALTQATSGTSTTVTTTGSSIAINVSLPVVSCTNGTVATAIAADGTVTCGNADPNNYAGTHRQYREEFLQGGTQVNGPLEWGSISSAGTGPGESNTGGTNGRFGIMQFSTGSGTANGRNSFFTTPTALDFGTSSRAEWRAVLDTEILSSASSTTYTLIVGFADSSTTVDQTDGCYFLYDKANTATSGTNSGNADKWSCWCTSNSNRTTYLMDGSTTSDESFTTVNQPVAAGSMPSTNVYNLDVVVTGTTRAEFYVNGVKSCDINQHIPSGASRMTGAMVADKVNAGSAVYTFDIDFVGLDLDYSSAPTP